MSATLSNEVFYSLNRLSEVLDESTDSVNDRVSNHEILLVSTLDKVTLAPAFQFTDEGKLKPKLVEVLQILLASNEPGWTIVYWLHSKLSAFGGLSALEVLDDESSELHELVRMYAHDSVITWRAA